MVRYRMARSKDSFAVIRDRQQATLQKSIGFFNLPAGVSIADMAEIWEAMNIGSVEIESGSKSAFDPSRFRAPSTLVQKLRQLANKGREDTDKGRSGSSSWMVVDKCGGGG